MKDQTNESMKAHIDEYVLGGGGDITEFIPSGENIRELSEIRGSFSKGGMSFRIFVNSSGKMEIEPDGYDGEDTV